MNDTRNASCEKRIDANLASRIEDLAEIIAAIDNDGGVIDGDKVDGDDALERLNGYALCSDIKTIMTLQISTGGPGDQFEVEVVRGDYGWELDDTSATYRFLDWFDGATRRTDNPTVMRYLTSMVERLSY